VVVFIAFRNDDTTTFGEDKVWTKRCSGKHFVVYESDAPLHEEFSGAVLMTHRKGHTSIYKYHMF